MSNDANLQEMQKLHFESHSKFVYFLLAATGAALGYALQKLDGLAITLWVAPGLFAVFCWLASFYAGCLRIRWTHQAIHADYTQVQLQRGVHLKQPKTPAETQQAVQIVQGNMAQYLKKSVFYMQLQFWLLTTGLASFVVWRVTEMLRITGAP